MAISVHLNDGRIDSSAKVTERGQLVTAPLDFSKFYNATAGTDNTPVQIVPPASKMCFVITTIIIYANKNVGAGDATVRIYEADGPTEAYDSVTDETIYLQEIPKNNTVVLTGLNIIVNLGKWVVGVTDDDDIFFNVSGYYVDA